MLQDKFIISEFYALEADRNLIKEAIQNNSTISVQCILQKAGTLNRNNRVYPYEILKREISKYAVLVKDRSAMGECVPAGTQIYTDNGWKNIEDTQVGDAVLTLNIDNGLLEIQNVENTIKKNYNDDMIHIYNRSNLDMMITKKHKVVVWDRHDKAHILTGEELHEKINTIDSGISHFYIKHSGKWIGDDPEFFTIPGSNITVKAEDWAAFLGIYISEGHSCGSRGGKQKRNAVTVTQVKEPEKTLIKELLNNLGFKYHTSNNRQFIIHNKELYEHLRPLGNSEEKYIPDYAKNWSPRLLNILFDWLLIGDGKNRKNRNGDLIKEYCTISKTLSEDVYNIILKLGYGATISKRQPKDNYITKEEIVTKEVDCGDGTLELVQEKIKVKRLIKAENCHLLYIIHCRESNGIYLDKRFVKSELIPFNDNVYCVSVPNKTWLMKYNNKVSWTHNCDHADSPVISLANVSHLVTEMWWEGETLHGKIEIAETPAGEIVKGLLKSGVKLGISSRGVGSVKTINEQDIVQDDFELISFDVVSSPSTPGAYLFAEGKGWGMKKFDVNDTKLLRTEELTSKYSKETYAKIIELSKDTFWGK